MISECDPPADVAALVGELLARKAVTNELGAAPVPSPIADFIDGEFSAAREAFPAEPLVLSAEARHDVETFFRATLTKFA